MRSNSEPNLKDEEQQGSAASRPFLSDGRRLLRRRFINSAANLIVRGGGLFIILCIVAILFVIIGETEPAFRSPSITPSVSADLRHAGEVVDFFIDEYGQTVFTISADGHARIDRIGKELTPILDKSLLSDSSVRVLSSFSPDGSTVYLGLSDGTALIGKFSTIVKFENGDQRVYPDFSVDSALITLDSELRRPISRIAALTVKGNQVVASQVGKNELIIQREKRAKTTVAQSMPQIQNVNLIVPTEGDITAFSMDKRGENLIVGSSFGELFVYDLKTLAEQPTETLLTDKDSAARITEIAPLVGDRTWIVSNSAGRVQSWMFVKSNPPPGNRFRKIHDFKSHGAPVTSISRSLRNRTFVTADEGGVLKLHYGTTGETLYTGYVSEGRALRDIFLSPRGNLLSVFDASNRLHLWSVHNPHPEVSFRALFGKLWYEGYDSKAYVWQSSGGSDDFEPKFSIAPLLLGTLKGTVFALIFAVPIAILSALFVSQFMGYRLRGLIKPIIELMAALPSVVIGFIAGLWLAPKIEPILPGLALMPFVITLLVFVAVICYRAAPNSFRTRVRSGRELVILGPVVVLGLLLSFQISSWLEQLFFGTSYSQWLFNSYGIIVDQRNAVIVGIAMGFAIIPIIFTIAEESLSSVPKHLSAASLALGASRWETAVHVVLPAATPGIFSAIMVGFGRAVGETMIVLMATGNTPVLNFSPFSGFRALSANIAVELPEAPDGGTLFRILFLSALLLFVLTFIVNTVTELVRLRLRERYKQL